MTCSHAQNQKIIAYKKNDIRQCVFCGLVFNSGAITHGYQDYYEETDAGRFNPIVEAVVKSFRFGRALRIKIFFPKAKSILDVGSGRGYTLYFLKKFFGFKTAIGTQISEPARIFSQTKLELDVRGQDLLDIDFGEKFDVVGLYHVLEHVPDPEKYIERIADIISAKGTFVIQVPNYGSWTNSIARDQWLALDPDNHHSYFTYAVLDKLIKKNGFRIISFNSFSLEYSLFTSVQSLVNRLTGTKNLLFEYLQTSRFSNKLILHFLLFILITPFALLINILLFFSQHGENLNIIAARTYD